MNLSKAKTAALAAGALLAVGGGVVLTIPGIQSVPAPRPPEQKQVRRPVSPPGPGENIVFPSDAGVVDVTLPPYNAKGDGQTDDTAAIQQAFDDNPGKNTIIYLPNGTYLVSSTICWGGGLSDRWQASRPTRAGGGDRSLCKRTILQGQNREATVIKLKDACPGFNDPATPQPMIWTGPKPAERFRNAVRNLTVDTGSGNPGAVGVQFNANIVGCMRDVLIRSADGQGVIGLDMAFSDQIGPLLIKNTTVRGFDVGIATKGGINSQTFEHITLENQNKVAFVNDAGTVSIRGLTTTGRVPAFWNKNWVGLAVIIDAKLNGLDEAASCAAITNRPGLFVRNLSVNGFAQAIAHIWPSMSAPPPGFTATVVTTNVPGPLVKVWSSQQLPGSKPSLNLPVKETPDVPWDDLIEWANPVAFGADPSGRADASDALQQAIDSGKRTVYLPRGVYVIRKPVVLSGKVRRLIGCEATLRVTARGQGGSIFTLGDGDSPVVVVERLQVEFPPNTPEPRFINNPSGRALVLRDSSDVASEFTGPGEVFLENVGGRMIFHGQKVWARQINQMSAGNTPPERWWHLRNEGGLLWVLGEMTEGPGPVAATSRGGQTEILGGLAYSSAAASEQVEPAFVVTDGALAVSINEASFKRGVAYPVLVRRVVNGQAADVLTPKQAGGGVGASLISLFATD